MIFEGSCDTEYWSNNCWKFSFAITGINYILKYYKRKPGLLSYCHATEKCSSIVTFS